MLDGLLGNVDSKKHFVHLEAYQAFATAQLQAYSNLI